jgi:hypothetical protein
MAGGCYLPPRDSCLDMLHLLLHSEELIFAVLTLRLLCAHADSVEMSRADKELAALLSVPPLDFGKSVDPLLKAWFFAF